MENTHTFATTNTLKTQALVIGLSLSGLLLTGCQPESKPHALEPAIRPALIETVTRQSNEHLSFNGVVRAAERADLSFRVGGRLTEILAQEGDRVVKGQLLAKLDSRDAEIALASAQLELNNVEAEYRRARTIYDKSQAISKSSLDELTTRFNLATNRRDEAKRQLDYTRVEAPFSGVIGQKLVDNHIQVQANAAIFTLHDLQDMEVVIHIPDSVMLSGLRSTTAIGEVTAIPNKPFNLHLRTHATQADAISQTYAVVLGFDSLEGYRVLPGMTVKVRPTDENNALVDQLITLPITALVPDNQGKQFVWLVTEENQVIRRYVGVGALSQKRVEISDGLTQGDNVVIAGVSSLKDGMNIRPVKSVGNNASKAQQ
ncbi:MULTISPECIES: efflux RND transporter periplasmic adaptor subunit [Vibrio]|uniref:efflux RND transporter periplasmic adaptor subunit n=1 Tax=Vibrio TaxID=662 RepID=UPI003D0B0874